jgi:hypothetical protein
MKYSELRQLRTQAGVARVCDAAAATRSLAEFILETGNSSNMNPGADEFPVRTFPSNLPV